MPDFPIAPPNPEPKALISPLQDATCKQPAPRWPIYLTLVAFAALWADLIHQLSYVWRTDEQYAYGWFVPLLAAGPF
jgi:hypothetical protein